MADEPLTNAALEWIRLGYASLNALEGRPADIVESVADDFVYEGRNRGVNFGRMTASEWPAFMASLWDVGAGRPQWSEPLAIAVGGQRCAAFTASIDYGNDTFTEYLHCIRVDPQVQRLQRLVSFDPEDVDDAVAVVDEWHAEIGD